MSRTAPARTGFLGWTTSAPQTASRCRRACGPLTVPSDASGLVPLLRMTLEGSPLMLYSGLLLPRCSCFAPTVYSDWDWVGRGPREPPAKQAKGRVFLFPCKSRASPVFCFPHHLVDEHTKFIAPRVLCDLRSLEACTFLIGTVCFFAVLNKRAIVTDCLIRTMYKGSIYIVTSVLKEYV